MKRFTRYVSLILVLVTVFMVPVSADDFSNDQQFIQVLDYSTANDTGSNYFEYTGSGEIRYALPYTQVKQYVDMIVWSTTSNFTLAEDSGSLTIKSIGNKLYRVYGSLGGYLSGSLYLTVSSTSTSLQAIEFRSIRFSSIKSSHFAETGTLYLSGGGLSSNISGTMSSSTDAVRLDFPYVEDSATSYTYTVQMYMSDWQLYDYVDFYFTSYVQSIDSISALHNGSFLPTSYMYIDDFNHHSTSPASLIVRVDLRGVDRTSTYTPYIIIRGFNDLDSVSYFQLSSVSGYVVQEPISDLSLHFQRLTSSLATWFSALQARQNAMHEDQMDFYSDNLTALSTLQDNLLSSLGAFRASVESYISALSTDLQNSISTLQQNLLSTLGAFRASMENYLDHLPARIAEEIAKIFKPTEGKFEAAKDESQELAEERLGAVYQSAVVIDQIAGAFTVQIPQTSIVIPLVSVEVLPGVPFQFGGWDVPIVPAGLEFLIDTLKYVIDIVCTLAFLNGMKRRLDGFFGGESGVD